MTHNTYKIKKLKLTGLSNVHKIYQIINYLGFHNDLKGMKFHKNRSVWGSTIC